MATVALLAQFALVNIILFVAADAGVGHRIGDRADMATFTSCAGMFAEQGKAGDGGVIEAGGFPVVGLMAAAAILAEFALVDVIAAMTAVADQRQLWRSAGSVATLTACTQVFAGQRKRGALVIEMRFLPLAFVVAALAVLAERAFVVVHLVVAAVALAWRFAERVGALVALLALPRRNRVGTAQQKVGLAVVKSAGIQ